MTQEHTLYVLTAAACFLVVFTIAMVLILTTFMNRIRRWQDEMESIVKESFVKIIDEIKK